MVLKITNLHILRYLPTCWLYLLERYTIDNQRCTHIIKAMAKKETSTTQRGQVKLREKKLADGSSSLYLDIYSNGKRVKEYLKLYLVVPNTAIEKEQNRQTLAVANSMRAKRELDLFNVSSTNSKQSELCVKSSRNIDTRLFRKATVCSNCTQ